ncbi:MAG: hypothetical protein EOM23_06330, partial [Candidatus Moranbacteria bacterium]|nr:hypothetical protein [Candidatus Moranbacteria bacterium]
MKLAKNVEMSKNYSSIKIDRVYRFVKKCSNLFFLLALIFLCYSAYAQETPAKARDLYISAAQRMETRSYIASIKMGTAAQQVLCTIKQKEQPSGPAFTRADVYLNGKLMQTVLKNSQGSFYISNGTIIKLNFADALQTVLGQNLKATESKEWDSDSYEISHAVYNGIKCKEITKKSVITKDVVDAFERSFPKDIKTSMNINIRDIIPAVIK